MPFLYSVQLAFNDGLKSGLKLVVVLFFMLRAMLKMLEKISLLLLVPGSLIDLVKSVLRSAMFDTSLIDLFSGNGTFSNKSNS
jgi:hypothetical protein